MKNNHKKPSPPLLNRLWKQFSSMKFAIIILVILAVVSVIALFLGEFYPVKATKPGWQEFWQQQLGWSDPVFNIAVFFKLHDPFRSWWYDLLLLTLSLSLFTCLIDRLPVVLQSMKVGTPRKSEDIAKKRFAAKFVSVKPAEEIVNNLPALFRFRKSRVENEWRISGLRGALGYAGPTLAHAGLLFLALGGLFLSLAGFKTTVGGFPGDIMTDSGFDFGVRVDSFMIEYYPLGLGQYVLVDDMFIGKIIGREDDDHFILEARSPENELINLTAHKSRLSNQYDIEMDRGNISDYITLATVIEDEQEISKHRIEVNKPLRHKGYRFYQTSFDSENPRVEARIDSALMVVIHLSDDSLVDTVVVSSNLPHRLPDGSEVQLAQFLPDFRMEGSVPTNASASLRNPAVRLDVYENGEKLYHQWSFLTNPFLHTSPEAAYKFQAIDMYGFDATSTFMTILAVQKSTGSWAIWLGFALSTLGMILAFYQTPQRLWVVIKDRQDGVCEVVMAGSSSKNPNLFELKFDGWVQRLKGSENNAG